MRKLSLISSMLVLLSVCLVVPSISFATTIYGPKTFTAKKKKVLNKNKFYHRSFNTFQVIGKTHKAKMSIAKKPGSKLAKGYLVLNYQLISLKNLLKKSDTFELNINVWKYNLLYVYFEGKNKPAVTIEIENNTGITPKPAVTFTADPDTIFPGEIAQLSWSVDHADTVTIDNGIGAVNASGTLNISPQSTTSYELTAAGLAGTAKASVAVTVNIPQPVVTLTASPDGIKSGESATLTWTSEHADTCTIEPGIGAVALSGSMGVTPIDTTAYTIIASGPAKTATATTIITVYQPPVASISVSPADITKGESATLFWNVVNADTCTIDQGIGTVPASGSMSVSPDASKTYTLTAQGPGGEDMASTTLTVRNPNLPPDVAFDQPEITIAQGSSANLTWTSNNADAAVIDNKIGSVPVTGSLSVSPLYTTVYTITVTGVAGTAGDQIRVRVTGNPEPQTEGTFGEAYQDLIPEDASLEAYDENRFALMTGIVTDITGAPLSGVSVNIHGHPEYGTAETNADGRYAIPVEGGNTLTVLYSQQELIPVQRNAYVPWNDFTVTDTIQMVAEDPAVTQVSFNGDPGTVFTHRSTPITTEAGTRAVTLVFTGDNQAYATDANGNNLIQLETINVRATEYQTPESMPAVLPPTSAFTYCAEFSVDGVQRVRFEKPVVTFVDNFLGFQVGTQVPVGYYDRDRAHWIPQKNGRVVKLLDTDEDGTADAMDIDGDDIPDDIDGDGSTLDETVGLCDPGIYLPGNTYWRFEADHFTPWDPNYPATAPPDSILPNVNAPAIVDDQSLEDEDCKASFNSYVEERSRIFHESLPIPGTDIFLHYSAANLSDPVTNIHIPLSDDTILPDSLEKIELVVSIAGKRHAFEFGPTPNQSYLFEWDGFDFMGRKLSTPVTATIAVRYWYKGYYGLSYENFKEWFAKYPEEATEIESRLWLYKNQFRKMIVQPPQKRTTNYVPYLAEGWTLSNHHYLDKTDPTILHKGAGSLSSSFTSIYKYSRIEDFNLISLVAGTGNAGYSGDNGPASQADFLEPKGVAVDAAGNVYIADTFNYRIRKIDTQGNITTIAGNGNWGDPFPDLSGQEVFATDVPLFRPVAIAIDNKGNVYFSDYGPEIGSGYVRKIDPNGMMSNVAGGWGEAPDGIGDNEPAGSPQVVLYPDGISADEHGNLFIADTENNRIRMVDPVGIITTIAGNGNADYSGDGGPSRYAGLNWPSDVNVDQEGNVYIVDQYNHAIRRIDISGVITTIAGTGSQGYSGDGGPATQAKLNYPKRMELDAQGNIYLMDWGNSCLRKITTDGIIKTVSGKEAISLAANDFPVEPDDLYDFSDLAILDTGEILAAFSEHYLIGKIGPLSASNHTDTDGNTVFTEANGYGHIMGDAGMHVKTIDLKTGASVYEFGYSGLSPRVLSSITDRFGNVTQIKRGADGVTPTAIISPEGLRTELSIDGNDHLTRITFPDSSHYDFTYSDAGLMETETDPNGNKFLHIFTTSGKIEKIMDENGGYLVYQRDYQTDNSILTTVTTGEGNQRTYLDKTDSAGVYTSVITDQAGGQTYYTKSGLAAKKINACGLETVFTYDLDPEFSFKYLSDKVESTPDGLTRTIKIKKSYTVSDEPGSEGKITLVQVIREVNGKQTLLEHDVAESRKTVTSPEGRTVTTLYNPDTLVPGTVQVPGFLDTTFQYDGKGRLTASATGTRSTQYTYDTNGFVHTVTDPKGNAQTFTRDANGRIVQVHRPDGSDLYFSYDTNGNVNVLTTPLPADHLFGYNKVNLQTSYSPPLSNAYSFQFDKDRRPTVTTFPSGKTIENVYEAGLDRIDYILTPDGQIDLNYLCGSKIGSVSKFGETISYSYDAGLVTSETLTGTLAQSLAYEYNNNFNLIGFSYVGDTVTYTYDSDGLLTSSGEFSIARNTQNGLPENVSNGGLNIGRTFNGYAEIESQIQAVYGNNLVSWALDRNDNGRITRKTETTSGGTSTYDYTYDSMGRLLTVTQNGSLVEEYQYNANGTRVWENNTLRGITGRTSTYSGEDHLVTVGNLTYQYDFDSFLMTKSNGTDTTEFSYSIRGELLNVLLPDGTAVEYVHDPLGRRIAKKTNGTITELYLWQGQTRLLAILDGSESVIQRFEYADGRMPVAMTQNGSTYYLAYDQVGSLRIVADTSGNVVKAIDYDSFGNIICDTNPAFEVPFGFAGGLHDQDTGLVRFGYRDYDPEIGRWTSKDPILFAGGDTDLFGYAQKDPINLVDPLGLKLSSSQNAAVTIISSAAAFTGSIIGTPAVGSAAGALAGVIATAYMGGDTTDVINNAFSGALGGYAGGTLGNLGKAASAVRPGASALGLFGGMGIDALLYGGEPLVDNPCE